MEALTEIISDFFNSIGQERTLRHLAKVRFTPESGPTAESVGMSALCHFRTPAPQQRAAWVA
jgi:hypothetical protein